MKKYKINKAYNFEGEWFVSGLETNIYYGTLDYLPKKNLCKLKIWGYSEIDIPEKGSIHIYGRSNKNTSISLSKCFLEDISVTHSANNIYRYSFFVSGAIVIGKSKNIIIKSASIEFTDQKYFLKAHGYSNPFETECGVEIEYEKQNEVELFKDEEVTIKTLFDYSFNRPNILSKKIYIKQTDSFQISFNKSYTIDEVYDYITALRYFLCLCTSKQHRYKSIALTLENEELVHVLDIRITESKTKHKYLHLNQNYFLSLKEIVCNNDILKKWLEIYFSKKSIINNFFELRLNDNFILEDRFLKLIYVFEQYARTLLFLKQNKLDDETLYIKRIAEVVDKCPKHSAKLVERSLKYGNEVDLTIRINNSISFFEPCTNMIFNCSGKVKHELVQKIVKTRNYLTHHNNENKSEIIKNPYSYFSSINLLNFLITLMLYKDLGAIDSNILHKLQCIPEYRKLFEYNWSDFE